MALADAMAKFIQRVQSNAPQLALASDSPAYNFALAVLSGVDDASYTLTQNTPNLAISTASGAALDLLAANYGVYRSPGTPAIAQVQFSLPADPPSTVTIPAGTQVAVPGDGVTSQAVIYTTTEDATISNTGMTSTLVPAQANTVGTGGNVAANTIVVMTSQLSGGLAVTNPNAVDGTNSTTLGTDPDTDETLRSNVNAVLSAKYGAPAIEAAIAAVPGVFASLVVDPQAGSEHVYYYWCDLDGNTPTVALGGTDGISGGTATASGSPDFTEYQVGATLAGMAETVDQAVQAVLPASVIARIGADGGNNAPFNVVVISSITVSFSAPATVQTSTITPVIQQAVVNAIQALFNNQVPTQFGIAQAVFVATGYQITNFVVTASSAGSPLPTSPALTTIYRCTGTPSSVVVVNRV